MGIRDAAFELPEYHERLARVRAAMTKARLTSLLITDPSNMCWLTGYDGWSFYVHQGVVVTHDSDPLWWGLIVSISVFGGYHGHWILGLFLDCSYGIHVVYEYVLYQPDIAAIQQAKPYGRE